MDEDYGDKLNNTYLISKELKSKYKDANYEISDLKPNTGHRGKYISCNITLL